MNSVELLGFFTSDELNKSYFLFIFYEYFCRIDSMNSQFAW